MRIKNITVFRDSQFSNKFFEWNDLWKTLMLFHLKNQTWKTTLYTIVRNLLSWKKIDIQKIDINIFWSASLTFTNWEDLIELKNNSNNFYWTINWKNQDTLFQDYMIKNIFKKDWDYKIIYWTEKTSLSSLLRLCFFSWENFTSQFWRIADIFFQIFDGKWRYILFLFCLGAVLNDWYNWNSVFNDTNQDEKLRKEKNDLEKELNNSTSAQEITTIKEKSLFAVDLDSNLYKKQQQNNISIDSLNEILKKIDILIDKSKWLELDSKFIEFLEWEKKYINSWINVLERENDDIDTKLSTFSWDKKDLLTYEQKTKRIADINDSLEEISINLSNALKNEKEIWGKYITIVNDIKSWNNKLDFEIDKDTLKILMENSSEWLLKWCKFLSNLALQVYAIKNSDLNWVVLFPFWFYDWVFSWSDEDVIIECLNSVVSLDEIILKDLQLFCFINKYTASDIETWIDKFAKEHLDIVESIKIKEWHRYLIW